MRRHVGRVLNAVFMSFSSVLMPWAFVLQGVPTHGESDREPALCLVVIDPLAAKLSCPCVEGYAQRDYDALGAHLGMTLHRPVKLGFGESLEAGLKAAGCPRADVVIGKDSVVRADANNAGTPMEPIAALTDRRGRCSTRGLFVVPADDAAETVEDVLDYEVVLGTPEHREKHDLALVALREAGLPEPFSTHEVRSCSDAAAEILESEPAAQAVALISSYAEPLLEGCGTVPRGALRVIGETRPVPFITAFVARDIDYPTRDALQDAILGVAKDSNLCGKLESSRGFIRVPDDENDDWPGWRGPGGTGHAARLPARLAENPKLIWSQPLARSGLGGLAASISHVVIGDRNDADSGDVFRCFDSETGEPLWELVYEARGELDYGNSPRATPLIENGRVHLFGAMGDLHCVDLSSGKVLWKRSLVQDFAVPPKALSAWGYCSSPLIADGRLIVNPGAPTASLVALNPATGEALWCSPGPPQGYGSFVAAYPGGRCQVIGFDESTLGGWDARTGARIWTIKPDVGGGFHVPTPVVMDDDGVKVLVSSETDGTRVYAISPDGMIDQEPLARSSNLASEMATPVVADGRVFCIQNQLVEMNARDGLRTTFMGDITAALDTYAAVIAGPASLLVVGNDCRLLLYDITDGRCRLVSDVDALGESVRESHSPVYSHPAIVGTRLFLRGSNELACLELAEEVDGDFENDVSAP